MKMKYNLIAGSRVCIFLHNLLLTNLDLLFIQEGDRERG
jgi:hypothetical protein